MEQVLHLLVIDKQVVLAGKDQLSADVGTVQQQSKKISGKVTDQSGASLPGASVVIKGTTTGVLTNNDGNFTLTVPDDTKILVVSFVGMKNAGNCYWN